LLRYELYIQHSSLKKTPRPFDTTTNTFALMQGLIKASQFSEIQNGHCLDHYI